MGIRNEDLEGGLFEAFKAPNESVLATIERLHGARSGVLLRDAEEASSPIIVRRPGPGAVEDDSRYQVLGEIARGGIGVVYRGRDKDLNRDIALKVLRPEYAQREDIVQRFVEEAQVAGQLQHPGIVPVYGIGLQHDGRPSFAMKLIKGQTLAELLDSNPRNLDLISIYEQITLTMAYAHSRGVIHRDLKPANVMVGAFGEVQVVDWGFAKILGQEDLQRVSDRTVIATVRSGPVGSQSIAGSVMGTPAYMPPEQALGHIEALDERSDVFALGAILCELLTGAPPYTGAIKDQLIAAGQSRLEPALERLEAAEAADDLKRVARHCLEPLPGDRPRNARILAERLSQHFASADERALQAEVDAVQAEADAAGAARARHRAVVRAVVALFVLLAGGGGLLTWKHGRDVREARAAPLIAASLRQATRHEGEQDWAGAATAAQRAMDVAASEGVDDMEASLVLARVRGKQRESEEAARVSAEDDAFLREIEEIRGRLGAAAVSAGTSRSGGAQAAQSPTYGWTPAEEHRDVDASYIRAFETRFGSVESSVPRLKSSRHRIAFSANLHLWSWLRRTKPALNGSDWQSLHRLARTLDPALQGIRDALVEKNETRLLQIASEKDSRVPVALGVQIGLALVDLGRSDEATAFLEALVARHPDDFWARMRLTYAGWQRGDRELAARHCVAALALRPRHASAWSLMAHVLRATGEPEEAASACRRAIELAPGSVTPHNVLGTILCDDLGRYDEALTAFGEAIELDPEFLWAQNNIGSVLRNQGKFEAAIEQHRKVIAMDASWAGGHAGLGMALDERGDRKNALASYQASLDLDPTDGMTWNNLAGLLHGTGDLAGAITAQQEALRHSPRNAAVNRNLATLLREAGQLDAALAASKRALTLVPDRAELHDALGLILREMNRSEDAIEAFEQSIALNPKYVSAYVNLATLHWRSGSMEEALVQANRAVQACPVEAHAWRILGAVQVHAGKPGEAIATLEKATDLDTNWAMPWVDLGVAYARLGNHAESLRVRRKAVEVDPNSGWAHYMLGTWILNMGAPQKALPHLQQAVRLTPRHAESWCNLAHGLLKLGRPGEAVVPMRRGHALGSARPHWSYPSPGWVANALLAAGQPPASAQEAFAMAETTLIRTKDAARALALYRKGFELDANFAADASQGVRYNAACSATLAGRASHPEALTWLRADLDAWSKLLARNPQQVVSTLTHWTKDPDLVAVRDAEDLPSGWKKLWSDVDVLLARAKEAVK